MKNFLLLLFILTTTQLFAQKKKKADPQLQIDSLTKASAHFSERADSLFLVLDSVSEERTLYYGLYTTIKEKVLKRDFDPADLPQIIDSLSANRESAFTKYNDASRVLSDSLVVVKSENQRMKAILNGINEEEAAKNRLVNEMKLLKELLDAKILTTEEFDVKKRAVLARWK